MKRVLIAASLGGLLLVGTPTLASSAQRNDSRAERSAADKGGDHKGDKGGDHKGGKRGGDHKSDRGDRNDRHHRGDRDRDRHHRHGHYRDRYWYGGSYWYGEPQDCWYGPSGAYNCEPYGGDYYGGGYHPGWSGRYGSHNRNVYVERHAFNPPQVHAFPGQEVLWIFRDSEAHTVTADNRSFDSGKVSQGEFRLVFEQPGSYSYHCAIHPEIRGRVLVQS